MTRYAFWAALVLACSDVTAAEDDALTTTTRDLRQSEGKPQVRYETVLRGKTRIMLTRLERDDSGAFVPRGRVYYVGRSRVMTEADEDRDGFFETMLVYQQVDGEERVEGFIRSPDGSVRPMDADALQKVKQMGESWKEFWDAALPPR